MDDNAIDAAEIPRKLQTDTKASPSGFWSVRKLGAGQPSKTVESV